MTTMAPPLDAETWELLCDLYAAAAELPAAERALFLARSTAGRPDLAREVEAMLAAGAPGGELELERELARRLGSEDGDEALPAGGRLGAWRLLGRLGRGGMGEVFLAERAAAPGEAGAFAQPAAVKLLRAGLWGEEAIARFHRERRILARLAHPAIVPLLDGGVAPDGRPYLVLQLVDGRPITRWADEERQPVAARLARFVEVCRAVEFAHGRLVVHRDLKPSNILVDAAGAVRLLDFGVAKVLGEDDAGDAPGATRGGAAPMTPERAAPEQLRGEPATTATDVWGLGVLLYELATGRLPFPDSAGVRDGREPSRPSRAAAEPDPATGRTPAAVAAARATTPKRLRRLLAGDLETVVAHALDPLPERRYGSAAALAADVEALLAGRPVAARPDSAAYRLRRFAGRHRAATLAGATAAAALVALALGATVQSARVARERDRATAEAAKARAVVELLVGLFGATDPRQGAGVDRVSIAELLEEGERRVADLAEQPAVRARMWHVLGAIHFERNERERAAALYERALAAGAGTADADADRAALLLDSARALKLADRGAEALRRLESLVAALEAARGGEGDPGPEYLARALQDLGEAVGGERGVALAERSLALRRTLEPARPEEVAAALNALAAIEFGRERRARARDLWREALALLEAEKGADHVDTLAVLGNLANVLDDPREQVAVNRRLLAARERALGPEAAGLAFAWNNLGIALLFAGEGDEALAALAEAQSRWRRQLGPAHPQTLRNLVTLARAEERLGRLEEALATHAEVRRRLEAAGAPRERRAPAALAEAGALLRAGRGEQALRLAAAALADLAAAEPEGSLEAAAGQFTLGRILLARGDAAGAVAAQRRAVSLRERLLPPASPLLAEARAELGRALLAGGEGAEGRALLEEALPAVAAWPNAHPDDLAALRRALDAAGPPPGDPERR